MNNILYIYLRVHDFDHEQHVILLTQIFSNNRRAAFFNNILYLSLYDYHIMISKIKTWQDKDHVTILVCTNSVLSWVSHAYGFHLFCKYETDFSFSRFMHRLL